MLLEAWKVASMQTWLVMVEGLFLCEKALKTYNQYHTDCVAAEGKLKEAERLEERHTGKSADLSLGQSTGPRRSSGKKIERLMEKVEMSV